MSSDRYCATRSSAFPLGRHRSLVYSRDLDDVTEVETVLTWILSLTQGSRTLEEHAREIARAGAGGDGAGLLSALDALKRAGLLQSSSGFAAASSDRLPVESPPPITTVGIVTADRPAMVRRAVASLLRHCDAHQRKPRVIVVDGSSQPANRAATEAAVTGVAASGGHDVQYVGPTEAARLCDRLTERGAAVPRLSTGTAGANRNLLLLLAAGEQILMLDDDVLCDPWMPARYEDGLAVTGHHHSRRETAFFGSRADALAAVERTSADLFAAHGAQLGRSLVDLISTWPRPADLSDGCAHIFSRLIEARPHVVKLTYAGLAGDSGTYCPYRLLFSKRLRAIFWSDEAMFTTAMTSREVLRVATSNVVTHDCSCMATCMGVSNLTVVPPFMPVGRNEDGVFGVMLAACDPSALFGHLPVGVIHDSDRPSARAGAGMLSATQSRLSELVIAFLLRFEASIVAASPEVRMRRMGDAFMDMAEMRVRDLVDLVTEVTLAARCSEIEQAETAADSPECPDYWRAALGRYRTEFVKHVTTRQYFLPVEFHDRGSVDAGYQALQGFLASFGQLLHSWPALWEGARALNNRARTV